MRVAGRLETTGEQDCTLLGTLVMVRGEALGDVMGGHRSVAVDRSLRRKDTGSQEAFWRILALGTEAEPSARDMLTSDRWMEHKTGVCLLQRCGRLTEADVMRARHGEHIAVRHAVGGH